jgi:uncharacterized protein YndB with AHSA1/START domain
MLKVEHSVVVHRPPDDVFVYLTEPANLPEWQVGVLEARSNGPLEAGATLTELRKFLGIRLETTLEVTEHEPSKRFSLRAVSGPVPIEVKHRLTPTNGGTRIDVVLEGEPRGFFTVAEPIVERAVRREVELGFATLKDLLEVRG